MAPTKVAKARTKTGTASLSLAEARAFWLQRQALTAPDQRPLSQLVSETGWVRTFGGADIYLALAARQPGFTRVALDQAVAGGELRVVPAVRGCMYLVPRDEVALALSLAEDQFAKRSGRELGKVGVSARELDEVGAGVLQALRAEPNGTAMTAEALRRALPDGLVRSLGERGKKAGISSPLPAALRLLEFAGRIERTLEGGRLDSERALWQLPRQLPKSAGKAAKPPRGTKGTVTATAAERHLLLARLFFSAAAPARAKDFAEWSGLSVGEVKAAIAAAELAPVAITDHEEALVPAESLPLLREAAPPAGVVFLGFEDNLLNQHGGPAPLVAAEHHDHVVPALPSIERPVTIAEVKHMTARPLLVDGLLVGLWEYDADAEAIVVGYFGALAAGKRKAVAEAGAAVARFLREQIGHARHAFVDNLPALRARVARVRALA